MARPRTIVDLLAEQPDDALRDMRESVRRELRRVEDEVARLRVEAAQIELALKRGSDRDRRLTSDEVLEVAREVEPPFTAAEVTEVFADRGRPVTVNAVRNHLNRLVDRTTLVKHDDGSYSIAPVFDFPSSPTDDDIPF